MAPLAAVLLGTALFLTVCPYRRCRFDAAAVAFGLASPFHSSHIKAQRVEQPECPLNGAGPSLAFAHL